VLVQVTLFSCEFSRDFSLVATGVLRSP